MKNILVVGSVNMDYTIYVNSFPNPGETIYGNRRFVQLGGKGANQAVAIANSGKVKCRFICAKGNDNDGDQIKPLLERDNLVIDIKEKKNSPTGNATILVDSNSENQIVIISGANGELSPKDIDLSLIEEADYIVLQNEISEETNLYVMREANRLNKVVVYNPAPYRPVDNSIFAYVDYFVPNKIELSHYSHTNDIKKGIETMINYGVKNIIVTLGTEGSLFKNNNQEIKVSACKVKAVDTVAAGDTYVGYFVSSLAAGYSVKEAMEYASKASSITVSRKGSIVSIPFGKEIF